MAEAGQGTQPDWLEPELATLTRDRFSDPGWLFERKLDGERCLSFRSGAGLRLMTRNQKEVANNYPEIAAALRDQRHGDCIVDGEIVAFHGAQTSFELLQSRIHVTHPDAALHPAGTRLLLHLRRAVRRGPGRPAAPAAGAQGPARRPAVVPVTRCGSPSTGTPTARPTTRRPAARAGRGSSPSAPTRPTVPGRSRDWLKFKCETNQEFVIGGFTDPQRSRIGFGALLLGYYDSSGRLAYAGKVGTGFDTRTLRGLHGELTGIERDKPPFDLGDLPRSGVHWVEPTLVAQVGFSEWTRDGQLRHPRFQGLRRDKAATEVVREIPT